LIKTPRAKRPGIGKVQRRLSKAEKGTFERLLAEFQAENLLPDGFVEHGSTRRLLDFVCPGISSYLPSRHRQGRSILTAHAKHCSAAETKALVNVQKETGGRVNFLSDVWQNVSRDHLLGCQLTLFGQTMSYALPGVGNRHDGVAIADELERVMKHAMDADEKWVIGAVVTDNAGQCGRARRILALRWPRIVFIFCFAHDINNLVKSVLKTPSFRQIGSQAAAVVNVLNASSSKWLQRAREVIVRFYGVRLALFSLCETRWNSMHSCFASLLRVRTALKAFARTYEAHSDFPDTLRVLTSDSFWRKLLTSEQVIMPLSVASFRLQRDENTLADVVISYRDIFIGFRRNQSDREELEKCVEARWAQCEQPLFMLAYVLHPKFANQAREIANRPTAITGR